MAGVGIQLLWVIILGILTIFIFTMIPDILDLLSEGYRNSTVGDVARDVAEIITVSGASPENISIIYNNPMRGTAYFLDISNRNVTVCQVDKCSTRVTAVDPYYLDESFVSIRIEKYREGWRDYFRVVKR